MESTARIRDDGLRSDLVISGIALALLAVLLVLSLRPDPGAAPSGASAIGTLVRSDGDVRHRGEDTLVWDQSRAGQRLLEGDSVFAGVGSEAEVSLGEGARLRVQENSLVVLHLPPAERGASRTSVTVEVLRGDATASAGAAGLALRVSENEVRAASGAELRVRVDAGRGARLDVTQGRVEVPSGAGAVTIAAGERRAMGPGAGVLGAAQRLAIGLVAPADGERVYYTGSPPAVTFDWGAVEGQGAYVFELAQDPAFETLFLSVSTEGTNVARPLAAGTYHWRVGREDRAGRLVSSIERRLAVVEENPPQLERPREGEDVIVNADTPLAILWRHERPGRGGGAGRPDALGRFAIELAAGPDFSAPAFSTDTVGGSAALAHVPPEGPACVRVRAVPEGRHEPPWSAPRCFTVLRKPRLRAPTLFAPSVEREAEPAPDPPEGP